MPEESNATRMDEYRKHDAERMEEYRKHVDEAFSRVTSILTSQGEKLEALKDAMKEETHKMELIVLRIEAMQQSKFDNLELRVERIEGNNKQLLGYIMTLAMAVIGAVVVWVVQQWGGSGLKVK